MTADVVRLLDEHRYVYADAACACGFGDHGSLSQADHRPHLAGVVAPLLERAVAEAAADVEAAVRAIPHHIVSDGQDDQFAALNRTEVMHVLADVPAHLAVAEAARLREPKLSILGTWLVADVGRHTCGTGPDGHYGAHEPGCGYEPVTDLSKLPGWDDLRALLDGAAK